MNEELYCEECGVRLTEESVHMFDGRRMCGACLERMTTVCDYCSRRIWNDDAEGDDEVVYDIIEDVERDAYREDGVELGNIDKYHHDAGQQDGYPTQTIAQEVERHHALIDT